MAPSNLLGFDCRRFIIILVVTFFSGCYYVRGEIMKHDYAFNLLLSHLKNESVVKGWLTTRGDYYIHGGSSVVQQGASTAVVAFGKIDYNKTKSAIAMYRLSPSAQADVWLDKGKPFPPEVLDGVLLFPCEILQKVEENQIPTDIAVWIPLDSGSVAAEQIRSRIASLYTFMDRRPVAPASYMVQVVKTEQLHPIQNFAYFQERIDGNTVSHLLLNILNEDVAEITRSYLKGFSEFREYRSAQETPGGSKRGHDHSAAEGEDGSSQSHSAKDGSLVAVSRERMLIAFLQLVWEIRDRTLRHVYLAYAVYETLLDLWNAGLMHCDSHLGSFVVKRKSLNSTRRLEQLRGLPSYFFPGIPMHSELPPENITKKQDMHPRQYYYFKLEYKEIVFIDTGNMLELRPILHEVSDTHARKQSADTQSADTQSADTQSAVKQSAAQQAATHLLLPCALYRNMQDEDLIAASAELVSRLADFYSHVENRIASELSEGSEDEFSMYEKWMAAKARIEVKEKLVEKRWMEFLGLLTYVKDRHRRVQRLMQQAVLTIHSILIEAGCEGMYERLANHPRVGEIVTEPYPWKAVGEELNADGKQEGVCSVSNMVKAVGEILDTLRTAHDKVSELFSALSLTTTKVATETTTEATGTISATQRWRTDSHAALQSVPSVSSIPFVERSTTAENRNLTRPPLAVMQGTTAVPTSRMAQSSTLFFTRTMISEGRKTTSQEQQSGKNPIRVAYWGANTWASMLEDTSFVGRTLTFLPDSDVDTCKLVCQLTLRCDGVSHKTRTNRTFCALFSDIWGNITLPGDVSIFRPSADEGATVNETTIVEWPQNMALVASRNTMWGGSRVWTNEKDDAGCASACAAIRCRGASFRNVTIRNKLYVSCMVFPEAKLLLGASRWVSVFVPQDEEQGRRY